MTMAAHPNHRLRPRARLMLTLGLELISSETVALAELVKNAYDADASYVLIRAAEPLRTGAGVIELLDDGTGMTPDVVAGVFLEPATAHRRRRPKSARGRRSTGEKGLGRFAVAKLAERMTLVTRTEGGDETRLQINWAEFEDPDLYLDEVEIPWSAAEARFFAAGGSAQRMWGRAMAEYMPGPTPAALGTKGTYLRLEGLRVDWDRELARDVERALSRLLSPRADASSLSTDFTIILDLPPALGEYSGPVGPPDELRRPHYWLKATVDASGTAAVQVRLRDDDEPWSDVMHFSGAKGREPQCGPFEFTLMAWDRDRDALAEAAPATSYQEMRQLLNRASGVSVYRDGFRVLPYGEGGNDWLELDRRRIDNPSRRLSNNQIIGTAVIGRDANPALFDQTNREGLVAGPAYEDFRRILLELLNTLERRRSDARPRDEKQRRRTANPLEPTRLDEIRAVALERGDSQLTALVEDAESELAEKTEQVREVVARYQRLATLGQFVDKMIHEVGQPTAASRAAAVAGLERIDDQLAGIVVERCEAVLTATREELLLIRTQMRVALDVLKRLAPFGGRRRGRPHEIILEDALRDVAALLGGDIKAAKTELQLPNGHTAITVDGTELQEVVLNLLTNALYWVTRSRKQRLIDVSVERNPDRSLSVLVSDSGPGVAPEDQERIFDPYFTLREGGVGLGLAIAGEIVTDYYGGELELVTPGLLGGATFRATLRKRVGT